MTNLSAISKIKKNISSFVIKPCFFSLPSSSAYNKDKKEIAIRLNTKISLTPQPQYKFDHPLTLVNCSLLNANTPPTKRLYISLKNHSK